MKRLDIVPLIFILILSGCTTNTTNSDSFMEIGKQYDSATSPVSINGKLAYVATQHGKQFIVMEK